MSGKEKDPIVAAASILGQRGGKANIANNGLDDLKERARRGGLKSAANRLHMAEIGRKGGQKLLEKRGVEYFQKIGARGGSKLKTVRDRSYYVTIGTKGGEMMHRKRLEREEAMDSRARVS